MRLLNVPHYRQLSADECQAACAAMVIDYWSGLADGGTPARLTALLDEFSFGFRPVSGKCPPAITGLVAMQLARSGLSVDFYSANPYGGGAEGLSFLKSGPWNFSDDDVENYARHAEAILSGGGETAVAINKRAIPENEVVAAIAAGNPVVAIVDLQELKDWDHSANHAVVITGIDDEQVTIQDPDSDTSHAPYPREKFFAAHVRQETDCDAYIALEESKQFPAR